MRNASLFHRVVLLSLVAAVGFPASPAIAAGGPGQWSRVTALRPDTPVIVTFVEPSVPPRPGMDGEKVVECWFVRAGVDDLVLYLDGRIVTIPRERVVKVAVVTERRPWYAIPLIVAAVAGGVVLCVGTLLALAEAGSGGWLSGDDSEDGWLTIFVLPVTMGVWAYRKTDNAKRSVKVIYRAPRPVAQAGL
jgi:hypothetical protein